MRKLLTISVAVLVAATVSLSARTSSQAVRADDFGLVIRTPGFGLYLGDGHHHVYRPYRYCRPLFPGRRLHYGLHSAPHIGPHWHWSHGYHVGPHAGPHIDLHGRFGHTGPVILWGF